MLSAGKMEVSIIAVGFSPDNITYRYQLQCIGGSQNNSLKYFFALQVLAESQHLHLLFFMIDYLAAFINRCLQLISVYRLEDVIKSTDLNRIKSIFLVPGDEYGPEMYRRDLFQQIEAKTIRQLNIKEENDQADVPVMAA